MVNTNFCCLQKEQLFKIQINVQVHETLAINRLNLIYLSDLFKYLCIWHKII